MATSKKSPTVAPEATSLSLPVPEPRYHVYLRMQVGSLSGDAGYNVQMTAREIERLLNGTATVVRLPERIGNATRRGEPSDDWRFLPLSNIVEITIQDFVWPQADYIAEAT